jgi:hypothetical protein
MTLVWILVGVTSNMNGSLFIEPAFLSVHRTATFIVGFFVIPTIFQLLVHV